MAKLARKSASEPRHDDPVLGDKVLPCSAEWLVQYYEMASLIAYWLKLRASGKWSGDLHPDERRYLRELARLERDMGRLFRDHGLKLDHGLRLDY